MSLINDYLTKYDPLTVDPLGQFINDMGPAAQTPHSQRNYPGRAFFRTTPPSKGILLSQSINLSGK